MDKGNDISVSLIVYGYSDAHKLTELLGVKPSKVINKGEPYVSGAGPVPRSIWEVSSGLANEATIEDHIASLLRLVSPAKEKIADVAKDYRTVISIGVRFNESNPEVELDNHTLREIADMGAALWFDIYTEA